MRHLSHPAQRGLTLIELMVSLAIAAILAMAAAPSFKDYLANSRLRENGNVIYMQMLFAQSEAIKRNTTVRVTVDDGEVAVTDRNDPENPVLLKTANLTHGVGAEDATLDFSGEGRPVDFATASIDLSPPSGLSCSTEIRCPGLRVDGGGAIRLCSNHTTNCD